MPSSGAVATPPLNSSRQATQRVLLSQNEAKARMAATQATGRDDQQNQPVAVLLVDVRSALLRTTGICGPTGRGGVGRRSARQSPALLPPAALQKK
jgi:hypothetical protein